MVFSIINNKKSVPGGTLFLRLGVIFGWLLRGVSDVGCGAKVCTSYGAEDAAELHSKRVVRSRVRKIASARALRMKLDCAESRATRPHFINCNDLMQTFGNGIPKSGRF